MRLRRLQAFALGASASVLALFAIGCPEPADLLNKDSYPAPASTGGSATAGSATGGSATAGSATAGTATGGSGMAGGGAACETACLKALVTDNCKLCHSGTVMLAGLDMDSPGLTARLKNQTADHPMPGDGAVCPSGDKLIDTMTPANSWLLKKVSNGQGTCGSAMPSPPGLAGADLTCMQTYVACVAGGT